MLTTIEFKPSAVADLQRAFEGIASRDQEYEHHLHRHDDNGRSMCVRR